MVTWKKIGQTTALFLSVHSLISKPKVKSVAEYAWIKKCNKTVECFVWSSHCSAQKEIHMHVKATEYKLCNFGDSTAELNIPIFAFEIGIAQYKDEQ